MTPPATTLVGLCDALAAQVTVGAITIGEAVRRVVAEPTSPSGPDVTTLSRQYYDVALTNPAPGTLVATLLHVWLAAHSDEPEAVFHSGLILVRAATDVLLVRDDADLYRYACGAAARMLVIHPQEAEYAVGMLRLAAYAYDPVDAPDNYGGASMRRTLRHTIQPIFVPRTRAMPDAIGELDHAISHLRSAAGHATGSTRGEILAHLAFAVYSRCLASGSARDLAGIDNWCAEAAALLSPNKTPLANNRLMLLCLLRERGDLAAGRRPSVPVEILRDGLMHSVLTGITAIRLFDLSGGLDKCGPIVQATRKLAGAEPDLTKQRKYLDLAACHSLPGDPLGCAARRCATPAPRPSPTGSALAADRIHAALCAPASDERTVRDAVAAARDHAPHLLGLVKTIASEWNWLVARRAAEDRDPRAILLLADAVVSLIKVGDSDMAVLTLEMARDAIADGLAGVDTYDLCARLNAMAGCVFEHLPEAGWRTARECLWMLVEHWAFVNTRVADECVVATTTFAKGPGFAAALARPGPLALDAELASALEGLRAEDTTERPSEVRDVILTGYLHSAERQPGATEQQRAANLRRKAQGADIARLMTYAGQSSRFYGLEDIRAALPDDGALFTAYTGGLQPADDGTGVDGVRLVLIPRRGTMHVAGANFSRSTELFSRKTGYYVQTTLAEDGGVAVHSTHAVYVTHLRRAILEEPLHGAVSRQGAAALETLAAQLLITGKLAPLLDAVATGGGYARLLVWPHEALYFLPLQLVPFGDGILADRFTVTVLPSVECLFAEPFVSAGPGVTAIACATGGVRVGLPVEPSVHRQAEQIAALFGVRPLVGDDATPAAALRAIGTTRYLHLAAHGTQDVDAPLFARVYLAGGAVHAHEILTKDLRGTELVTLSACESALQRYDFLDNAHGLAPAFLRAGARAVIGAVWPVTPSTAETFFTELYTRLALGESRVAAFRSAQHHTRKQHPDYRDWGAFIYYGS